MHPSVQCALIEDIISLLLIGLPIARLATAKWMERRNTRQPAKNSVKKCSRASRVVESVFHGVTSVTHEMLPCPEREAILSDSLLLSYDPESKSFIIIK